MTPEALDAYTEQYEDYDHETRPLDWDVDWDDPAWRCECCAKPMSEFDFFTSGGFCPSCPTPEWAAEMERQYAQESHQVSHGTQDDDLPFRASRAPDGKT